MFGKKKIERLEQDIRHLSYVIDELKSEKEDIERKKNLIGDNIYFPLDDGGELRKGKIIGVNDNGYMIIKNGSKMYVKSEYELVRM